MDPHSLAFRALFIIPTLLSLSVHEFAHAWMARRLGDRTAEQEGRLTLNPIAHIDPLGTILLPLLGVPFGWAKPVPVNPVRFNRNVTMSTGMALTAAAGPISNLILALICTVLLGVSLRVAPGLIATQQGIFYLLIYGVQLNVGLAIFNMLPLPPLDGSRIVERFMPRQWEDAWANFARFGPFVLFAVIASGGMFLAGPIGAVTEALFGFMQTIARG